MKRSKSWSKNAVGVAGAMLLVSALAFSQSDQNSAGKTKAAPKATQTQAVSKAASSSGNHSGSKSHSTKVASTRTTSRKGKRSSKTSWRRGQQKVDPARAREIQQALIRQHYLSGSATGKWDPTTEEALRKFQGDNGWQNKTVPDSRALIKLGLGPSHDHLLNPESAMTTAPDVPSTSGSPAAPATHPPDAAGSSNQPQP